jgi:dCMP deaminase
MTNSEKWQDIVHMRMAKEQASRARCLKKSLGCVLVTTTGEVLGGTNGPPEPLDQCGEVCPRLDDHSGTNLEQCRAVHAEREVLLEAAKRGISTHGAVLYTYMGIPCKDCMLELIRAGVFEIVAIRDTLYDEMSRKILDEWKNRGGKFRVMDLEDL